MYFVNSQWYLLLRKGDTIRVPTLKLTVKWGGWFTPRIRHFGSEDERDKFLNESVSEYHYGVTTLSGLQWHHNIGHFLFDGLNSIYQAVLRFKPPTTPLFMIVGMENCVDARKTPDTNCVRSESVLRRFAGPHGFVRADYFRDMYRTQGALVETLITGNDLLGIHEWDADLQLRATVPAGLQHFRDRIYRTHGLPVPAPVVRCEGGLVRQGAGPCGVPRGFIVQNKRYTPADLVALKASTNTTALNLTYISWGDTAISERGFVSQLKHLSTSHVYVTGPGTGMLYCFLMPDGAVVVNLGGVAPANGPNPAFFRFMEMHIMAAAWYYQTTFYYNSSLVLRGVQVPELQRLYGLARGAVGTPAQDPATTAPAARVAAGRANLSPEGRVWVDVCTQPDDPCRKLINQINNRVSGPGVWECIQDGWVVPVVYELLSFAAVAPNNKTALCPNFPREQFRAMKARYRHEHPGLLADFP